MQSVILGTAQWGLDYGITNSAGRLGDRDAVDLAHAAWRLGVRRLDTAPAYGDAEERIPVLAPSFEVQTKVSVCGDLTVAESVAASLRRLGRGSLDGVLVHDWSSAEPSAREAGAKALEQLRESGLVAAVGVSGYGADDVASALAIFTVLDLVQVPVSVLDQRLSGSAELGEVRARGGRVQARSVFLQGAALAPADHAMGAHPDVVRLRGVGRPVELCLGFIAAQEWIDEVVVAATSAAELEEIMAALERPVTRQDWPSLASNDLRLVDPRHWTDPIGGRAS